MLQTNFLSISERFPSIETENNSKYFSKLQIFLVNIITLELATTDWWESNIYWLD